MGEKNGQVSNLLEDGWFFGNSLLSRSNSSKIMVRCNSDPCSSSSSSTNKEENLGCEEYKCSMSSLFRNPSLPPYWGRDRKYRLDQDKDKDKDKDEDDEDEDEDDEPRMGDLIRQAMPMPAPPPMPRRRLDRTPSLPPCRVVKEGPTVVSNGESGDLSVVLKKKGPVAAVSGLTRRASIDSSMLLPPKCTTTSKGTRLSTSNSKNRPHRKPDPPVITTTPEKTGTKLEKLEKVKSDKSLSDLEVEELQGFKDLGFSFDDNKEIDQSVTNVLPALQRRASLDSSHVNISKVRRPYLSESWHNNKSSSSAPHVSNKWADPKASLSDDMKAQIKFWARAVASNVRQEC